MPKHTRTKATNISSKVRKEVLARDGYKCIACGSHEMLSIAHYISRSHSGMGIPRNLVTLCIECHHICDNGKSKEKADDIRLKMKTYLARHYVNWRVDELIFDKWQYLKGE